MDHNYQFGYVQLDKFGKIVKSFSEGHLLFDLDYYYSMKTLDQKINYYKHVFMMHATADMKEKFKELFN